MKKIAQDLGKRDLASDTPNFLKKAQNKLGAKKKRSLEKRAFQQHIMRGLAESSEFGREEGEIDDQEESGGALAREQPEFPHSFNQQQSIPTQQPFNRIPKKNKGGFSLVDPVKLKKLKHKSLSLSQPHQQQHPVLAPPKLFATPQGGLQRPRGRPPKKQQFMQPMFPQQQPGGVPLPPAALANLGRGLMDDRRPFKIKKSHMEPDMRSLIPEVQLDVPPMKTPKTPKPPKMQSAQQSQNLDILMGLPAAPGLIPSANFGLPPPPPLKKMPSSVSLF